MRVSTQKTNPTASTGKAAATKPGEVATKYTSYDQEEKSLLEWAVEDSKFKVAFGLLVLWKIPPWIVVAVSSLGATALAML